ncbi:MAG TPA: tRNA adenosine(34) deaminase TadA [Kofleriaceae bacterium]|nr:tRNA adenosine(34) deaminase TadA [Kofleriaceae bacterium]
MAITGNQDPQGSAAEADQAFMREALAEAAAAGRDGDVPVGSVVVLDGSVIGRGRNRRQATHDPTAHAEIEALRRASQTVGNWRVEGTLYVTQEPCPMCAGALVNARVLRLVYGCFNPKAGAVATLYQIATDARLNHRLDVTSGVLADECAALLRRFFEALRVAGRP